MSVATARSRTRVKLRRRVADRVAAVVLLLMTGAVIVPLVLVLGFLVLDGLASVDADFFTRLPAPPGQEGGGLGNAIVGSGVLVGLALAIGVPLGVATGVLLAEFPRNRVVPVVRTTTEVVTGIPALVIGLVAYGAIVVPMGGFSALSGGVALAVMMVPYVAKSTEGVLNLVPRATREAGYALGMPRWRVTTSIVLPNAVGGIVTGTALALARVAGEAAPLLFTAFGNAFWNRGLDRPIDALPLAIYRYSIAPYDEWNRLASAAALVLVVVVLGATALARLVLGRSSP